jgi:hypothetical protein
MQEVLGIMPLDGTKCFARPTEPWKKRYRQLKIRYYFLLAKYYKLRAQMFKGTAHPSKFEKDVVERKKYLELPFNFLYWNFLSETN